MAESDGLGIEQRVERLERIVALAFLPPESPHPSVQHIWRLVKELRAEHDIPEDFDPWSP